MEGKIEDRIKFLKWNVFVTEQLLEEEKQSHVRLNFHCELQNYIKELYEKFGLIRGVHYN